MAEARPWVVDPSEVVEYERLTPPARVSSLVANDICGAQHVAAGLVKFKGRTVTKRDIHDEEELYYVVSGRAKIEMGGETFYVKPGMVVYIPAKCWHQSTSLDDEELCYFWSFGPQPKGTPVYLRENWIKHEPANTAEG